MGARVHAALAAQRRWLHSVYRQSSQPLQACLMLTLRTGFTSPFGRKARIAIAVLGLEQAVRVEPASAQDATDPIQNRIHWGRCRFSSSRMAAPFTTLRSFSNFSITSRAAAGSSPRMPARVLRRCGSRRWPTASWMRRSSSPTKAAIARPIAMSRSGSICRLARSRAACPRSKSALPGLDDPPNVGQITLACALGYRDLRFKGAWRQDHPGLVAWLDAFAARVPAFAATLPPP